MKSVNFRVWLTILIMALCSESLRSKLVKTWNQYDKEFGMKPVLEIKHGHSRPHARKLQEDEIPEVKKQVKLTGPEFLAEVVTVTNTKLTEDLAITPSMSGEEYIYTRNGRTLLTVTFELKDEEEMKFQYVEIQFKNVVIDLELKIEKTRLKGYVADYLFFYATNAVLAIRQTILSIDDIMSDFNKMLGYVCETSKNARNLIFSKYKGKPKPPPEERRLELENLEHENFQKRLKAKPILAAMKVFPLDLKNKKYISSKPGVKEYIKNLELPSSPRYEPRERKLGGEGEEKEDLRKEHETLTPANPRFIYNKLTKFTQSTMEYKDYLKLAVGNVQRVSGTEMRFMLFTSRPNLSDVQGYLRIGDEKAPITIELICPSFEIRLVVSVCTSRFTIKHGRILIETAQGLLQILDHLNDLRVWRDFWPGHKKHQWRIHELIQPSIIYMMYREMFDSMTDGQTAQANPEDEGILHYSHTITENGEAAVWEFDVYGPNSHMLHDAIAFKSMGEDFPTAYMTGEMFTSDDQEHGIFFGNREVPEESMFNQHFLLKKYMELQVEYIIRSSPDFKDYKDDITPFITDAYGYVNLDDAPEVRNPEPGKPLLGYRYSTDVVGADKLEAKVPGDRIVYRLCPVLSTEYHDNIQLTHDGYIFTGGRFYFRKDIDYCYEVLNPSEDKLRMIQYAHENPDEGGGDDRMLKEIDLGQLV